MEEAPDLLLRVYERTLDQLRGFDVKLGEQFKLLLAPGRMPSVRDLAFIEGLRSERDQVLDGLREIEASIFNHLLEKIAPPSRPAD